MTLRTFILIIIAVALWVKIGLNLHENPHYYDNLFGIVWSLIKLLLLIWIGLIAVWLVIYLLRACISGRLDNIEIPERIWTTIWIIMLSIFIWCIIYAWAVSIKEAGWFKKWCKNCKDKLKKKRQEKKERLAKEKQRVAKMSKKELKEYKKSKRPWIRFRLLIWFPAFILIGFIVLFIYLYFKY